MCEYSTEYYSYSGLRFYGAAFATLVSYVCVWLIRALLAKKQMEKGFIDRNSLIIMVLIAFQIVIELSSLDTECFCHLLLYYLSLLPHTKN